MNIAIKSNKALIFDSARGVEGIVTIGIRLYQKSETDRMFFIRTYTCEDADGNIHTLPEREKFLSVQEINGLAQLVNARGMINNATFIQDFERVIQKGLLLQTQQECQTAIAEGKSANFGSEPQDWVSV